MTALSLAQLEGPIARDDLRVEPIAENLSHYERYGSESIDRAAVYKDGIIYSLSRPARHHNVLHAMIASGVDDLGSEQGFVTTMGRWVRRKPALRIAAKAGQLKGEPTAPYHGLFSEDVW